VLDVHDDCRWPSAHRAGLRLYTGGIDAHQARDWVVRANRFTGIYCEDGEVAEHAIHFWTGSRDTLIENNVIVNCSRGIGLGLVQSGAASPLIATAYRG
jgi:hypothetical protein